MSVPSVPDLSGLFGDDDSGENFDSSNFSKPLPNDINAIKSHIDSFRKDVETGYNANHLTLPQLDKLHAHAAKMDGKYSLLVNAHQARRHKEVLTHVNALAGMLHSGARALEGRVPAHLLSTSTYLNTLGSSAAGSAGSVARDTAERIGTDPSIGQNAGQVNPRPSVVGESWEHRQARSAESKARRAEARLQKAKQEAKSAAKRKAATAKAVAQREARDKAKAAAPKPTIGRPKNQQPAKPAPKRPRGRPAAPPIGKAEVIARVQARETDRINKKNSNK